MMSSPPAGSAISLTDAPSGRLVTIPHPKASRARYFPMTFLAFWLCGWLLGEVTVLSQLLTRPFEAASLFLVVWLCVWTVGGAFAGLTLRRMLKRSIPETLLMTASGLTIDSGLKPVNPFSDPGWKRSAGWNERREAIFPKRMVETANRRSLETLQLREGDSRNRLTLDIGAHRVELAASASDVEREWLFKLISDRYRLHPAGVP